MKRLPLAIAGVVAALVWLEDARAQTPPAPTAVAIYQQTRDAVSAVPLPPYILFTEQNHSTIRSTTFRERLRMLVRASDGHAYLRLLNGSDGSAVHEPARIIDDGRAPTTIVRVGDFPLADFGLRRTAPVRPGIFEAPGTPEPAPTSASGPAVIGRITTANLPYQIVDLGATEEAGRPVYHLGLTPVRDAGHHVLRELWIDRASFLPVRLIAERFVDEGPIKFRYLIDVTCDAIDGHLVNTSAGGHIATHLALLFRYTGDSLWTISDVSFPADPPPWAFDPAKAALHHGERVPGVDPEPSPVPVPVPSSTARTKS